MAVIDFPASPTDGQIFVATNGQTYTYSTAIGAWLLQIGPGYAQVVIGITPPPSPTPGQLWWNSDGTAPGGQMFIRYDDGTSAQWVPASPPASVGQVATPVYDALTSYVSDAAGVALTSDVILQITQGTQFWSRSFTALDATHPIEVDLTAYVNAGTTGILMAVGLFVDGAANAVAQMIVNANAGTGSPLRVYWQGVLAAGPHTFTARLYSSSSGTNAFLNGNNVNRFGGGTQRTTMTVREIGIGPVGPPGPPGPTGSTWQRFVPDIVVGAGGVGTIDITGIPNTVIALKLGGFLMPVTNSVRPYMRFSQGGVFRSGASDYYSAIILGTTTGASGNATSGPQIEITSENVSNDATVGGLPLTNLEITNVQAPVGSVHSSFEGGMFEASTTSFFALACGGAARFTGPIDGVRLFFQTGNIAPGSRVSVLALYAA
jgi:hypothetical protein